MRLAFALQRYMPEFTWETTLWRDPQTMMDAFMLRSKNYGWVYETHADVWVVSDARYQTGVHRYLAGIHAEGIAALYENRRATPLVDVPWGSYDVVITIDAFLDRHVTECYPSTLFCYYAGEHEAPDYDDSCLAPLRGYDVFMDHVLRKRAPSPLRLPVSVPFPALASRRAFLEVFGERPDRMGVFLDSRILRKYASHKQGRKELCQLFQMPVLAPDPWDYKRSYLDAAHRRIMSPRAYLERMGQCRYFLLMRGVASEDVKSGLIGQAAIEAAAMGCIVLSGHGAYPDRLCHEVCYIDPNNINDVARALRWLEQDERLRAQVLAHQYDRLKDEFFEGPMRLLGTLLEIKRATG